MKILNLILSVYLVFLSCIPCSDTINDVKVSDSVSNSKSTDKHSHETSDDFCSPFCFCNCCGQTILNYQTAQLTSFQTAIQEIKVLNLNYNSSLISVFSGSIWQPPKIV